MSELLDQARKYLHLLSETRIEAEDELIKSMKLLEQENEEIVENIEKNVIEQKSLFHEFQTLQPIYLKHCLEQFRVNQLRAKAAEQINPTPMAPKWKSQSETQASTQMSYQTPAGALHTTIEEDSFRPAWSSGASVKVASAQYTGPAYTRSQYEQVESSGQYGQGATHYKEQTYSAAPQEAYSSYQSDPYSKPDAYKGASGQFGQSTNQYSRSNFDQSSSYPSPPEQYPRPSCSAGLEQHGRQSYPSPPETTFRAIPDPPARSQDRPESYMRFSEGPPALPVHIQARFGRDIPPPPTRNEYQTYPTSF